jgi:hypothetical protein
MIETNTNTKEKLRTKKQKIKEQLLLTQQKTTIAKEDFEKKQQEVIKADTE